MYKNNGKTVKEAPSRYFKAYLNEVVGAEGKTESHVKCVFSKKPFSPEQFLSLMMGVMEAYAEELLTSNPKEAVYDNFNNAFGIFLAKLVPDSYIYEHDEAHKSYKESVDATLGGEPDEIANQTNRLAAYILARGLLIEAGLTEETADMLINKHIEQDKTENVKEKD